MRAEEIRSLLNKQRAYFRTGLTLPLSFRREKLRKLYSAIKKHEVEIKAALKEDLGKSSYEAFMTEIGMTLSEISHMMKNMKSYARRELVKTPLSQFPAISFKQPVPYGNTLIMSPWNYPLLLTLSPLSNAIAAGNTAIIKPSAYAPKTAEVVKKIVEENFQAHYIAVVTGGREENQALLDEKFDFIFFTGSGAVGKEVLRKAAEHLTPVVLELGGKSPCIVDKTANIKLAAKRIVFGKFLNCGQTCVAPDYILCEKEVKEELIEELVKQIKKQYGPEPLENQNYGKIINEKHFRRLLGLINEKKVVVGGQHREERLQIAPTLMDFVNEDDAVMKEEIFGPILPVLEFEDFDKLVANLKTEAKPLALYLFTKNKKHIKKVITELSYGGGCINDVIVHLASSEMGFGGVGESGMGSYHGRAGFEAFSHTKSIVHKKNWLDLPFRYQPYKKNYEKLLRLVME